MAGLKQWRRLVERQVAVLEDEEARLTQQLAGLAAAGATDPRTAEEAGQLGLIHQAAAQVRERCRRLGREREAVAQALRGQRQVLAQVDRWQQRVGCREAAAAARRDERALAEWWAGRLP